MRTELSKAEQNALEVDYDVLGDSVHLDKEFIKKYLVRGNGNISDQEAILFMMTCKAQKLNPMVGNEVYLIKYGSSSPAQMVIGKDAYLRRAYSNPDYLFKKDGITVNRYSATADGKKVSSIIQKEGCCLYPNEDLIGGWCRVYYIRGGRECEAFKEVALSEYSSGQSNWKSKPATMITKVAVSQCIREAFPKDYEGLYSEDEMLASGAIPANPEDIPLRDEQSKAPEPATAPPANDNVIDVEVVPVEDEDGPLDVPQRKELFAVANQYFGKDANAVLKEVLNDLFGITNTVTLKRSQLHMTLDALEDKYKEMQLASSEDE